MALKKEITKIVLSLNKSANTSSFQSRITSGRLIRDENPLDHFCVMVAPVDKKSRKVYLGHHKKANDWIPPGGHIDKNEIPVETAIREAKEELEIDISEHQLKLFTLDFLDVSGPNKICKMHWHIWYLFETEETNYKFDTREFHNARWFSVDEALKKIRIEQYRKTIATLR